MNIKSSLSVVSSHTQILRSKEHDASATPNSGCAHASLWMEPACARHSAVLAPVRESKIRIIWSEEHVATRWPKKSYATSWTIESGDEAGDDEAGGALCATERGSMMTQHLSTNKESVEVPVGEARSRSTWQ